MKLTKKLGITALLGSLSLGLTACDPPMPPDVAAALAEQTYTCIEGEATVSGPQTMQDLLYGWADSLTFSCYDPEPAMTMAYQYEPGSAQIEISDYPSQCSPVATVPLATEAAVIIYMQAEVGSLNLSPKSIAGIMDGSITNWNQLAKDNPGYEMPDFPLAVKPEADRLALESMLGYLKSKDLTVSKNKFKSVDKPVLDDYLSLGEGEVAIVPNSFAVALGFYPASIYLGEDQDGFPILATPDVSGIVTGGTQWVMSKDSKSISLTLDPNKTPTPPDGSDVAPTPYQAIYPVNLNICQDELLPRAIARFLLRLDSQGALGASNYAPLPEAVRIEGLLNVSKGLPTPTPVPTE